MRVPYIALLGLLPPRRVLCAYRARIIIMVSFLPSSYLACCGTLHLCLPRLRRRVAHVPSAAVAGRGRKLTFTLRAFLLRQREGEKGERERHAQ